MSTRRLPSLVVAATLLAGCGTAQALCTIVCSCSVSASPLSFGAHNPIAAGPTDSATPIKVDCGGVAGLAIPYRVDLSKGSGSYAARSLKSGSNVLAYNLYVDNARLQVWGDGTAGTQSASGGFALDLLGLAPSQTLWVYGRIPSGQTSAVPGAYADTITVTLTYY